MQIILKQKLLNQMNIVSPRIDEFYTQELTRAGEKNVPILLITRDRYLWEKKERRLYDELLSIPGMSVINNPNVNYLLIFNTELKEFNSFNLTYS